MTFLTNSFSSHHSRARLEDVGAPVVKAHTKHTHTHTHELMRWVPLCAWSTGGEYSSFFFFAFNMVFHKHTLAF